MRRKDQDVTSPKTIEAVLANTAVCRLGMCLDNIPYVVPVNFVHTGTTVFLHGSCAGKKMDILRKNQNVFFEATREGRLLPASDNTNICKSDFSFQSLMASGAVEFVENVREKTEVLDALCKKYYGKTGGMSETAIRRTCVFKIILKDLSVKQSGEWDSD